MATVLRIDGYIVRIWSNDHLPCHVHIFKDNGECVINLVGENGNPELREFYGMKRKEVAKAIRIVYEHQKQLIAEWNQIHGE
ncbi:MAG TPA: DUF4160 domain-containing protein [Cyanothece sp. UBA12306]|nr:DUF4160 domain-containing protein [Cyanothece sp. UBA12306]